MKRLFVLIMTGALLAILMAGVANSQCPGGVCPMPQQQWRQSPPARQPARPFVCRIYNTSGSASSIGSGSLVAKGRNYGVVVTCCHLFGRQPGNLTLRFPDGTSYTGTVIVKNRQDDLAFIRLASRPRAAIVKIATDHPKPGERTVFAGYGRSGQYREVSGKTIGYVAWDNGKTQVLNVTGGARQGDSGGPILNGNGELVAVLATTGGSRTQGMFNGRICRLALENRYVFPWNADLANKKDARKREGNIPLVPVEPVPLPQQQPPVDLSGVNASIADLRADVKANMERFAPLETTAEKARQLAKQWPELQAALKTLEQSTLTASGQASQAMSAANKAIEDSGEASFVAGKTKAELDIALDENKPTSRLGKLKARLENRIESTITGKLAAKVAAKTGLSAGWLTAGGFGIIAILFLWFLKREADKAGQGEQILAQRLAAMTPSTRDDAVADKLAVLMAKIDAKLDARNAP